MGSLCIREREKYMSMHKNIYRGSGRAWRRRRDRNRDPHTCKVPYTPPADNCVNKLHGYTVLQGHDLFPCLKVSNVLIIITIPK